MNSMKRWILLLVSLHACGLFAQSNCIDLTDLNAPFIHCTYGVYSNPYAYEGVVPGRHTVITEQGGDPTIGGFWYYGTYRYLYMIPPEETYSVRLGDYSGGRRAESIAVDITIDTNDFDLLILKYAAVLENPPHTPTQQPRFKFELLDTVNNLIDSTCFFADFVADTALGWNQAGIPKIILWKDWTNVGFDMSAFHNQTVRARLTTYDCDFFEHIGYAYFLLKCGQKQITADVCGDVDQFSYSAPEGFNYEWFWRDDPGHIISNNRTVRVSTDGSGRELGCHVSFTESPSCGFDLYTKTFRRFPMVAGRAILTDCPNGIQFVEESAVSNDGVHPDGTGNPCDDILWDFGDGQVSSDPNPTHAYSIPGDYTVSLVAGLNGFACADTAYLEIHIPEDTLIDAVTCEPYMWDGDVYPESGVYHKSYPTATGCDSLVTLRLDANYDPLFTIQGDHWPVGGTELSWTQYTYDLVFDTPYCSVDSVGWSVGCPTMSVLPSDDGLSCELRIFSFLPATDSVPLRAVAHNRCGTVERTIWIHTSFYGVDDGIDPAVDVIVYPNPSSGWINIGMKSMAGETQMELYDCQGLLVDRWIHFNKSDDETLVYDGRGLGDGLYTLRILHGKRSTAKKFMVSR